jgi:hypothetical protein
MGTIVIGMDPQKLPPVVVFRNRRGRWLLDGANRTHAHWILGTASVRAYDLLITDAARSEPEPGPSPTSGTYAAPGATSATMAAIGPDIPIPGSGDLLELAPTPDGFGYTAGITRRRSDGSAVWAAFPPRAERQDSWTSVRLDGHQLIANPGQHLKCTSIWIQARRSPGSSRSSKP